jgi:hypothetical protein
MYKIEDYKRFLETIEIPNSYGILTRCRLRIG